MKSGSIFDLAIVGLACVTAAGAGSVVIRTYSRTHVPVSANPRFVEGGAAYANSGHVLGNEAAPYKIVEFSDFQCPACRFLHPILAEFRGAHPEVAVVYRHYPITSHIYAVPAALAAECAAEQGRFATFAGLAFEAQDTIARVDWTRIAAAAGVPDLSYFEECTIAKRHMSAINADIAAARALPVTGTPTLLFGNILILGVPSSDSLEGLLATMKRSRR